MAQKFELEMARSEKVYKNIQEAFSFIYNYKKHMIGQLLCVLYEKDDEASRQREDLGCLVAIGTKDYRKQPGYGDEYFEIIPTSGRPIDIESLKESVNNIDDQIELYNTIVNVNKEQYTVLNSKEDMEIEDAFSWKSIKNTNNN